MLLGQDGDDRLEGGAGEDFLLGQSGADVMLGGDDADRMFGGSGDDTADGDRGDDVASLGDGNDLFLWDPGDGSDTVEGQAGDDRLDFNGSNASEEITFSASAGRAILFRNVASITMDLDGLEHVNLRSLGGTDVTTVEGLAAPGTLGRLLAVVADTGGLGGLFVGLVVEVVTRYATGGTYWGHPTAA